MIQLSQSLLGKLNLTPERNVLLTAGIKKVRTIVRQGNFQGDRFLIAPRALVELNMPPIRQPLAFYFNNKTGELKIGPVVAIMSGIPVMLLDPEVVSLYTTIAETASRCGMIFYLFTPDLIDFKAKKAGGVFCKVNHPQKSWALQEFPLPDVIYNQAGFVSDNLKGNYRKLFLQYLHKWPIKTINPFLALNDKLIVNNRLLNYPPARNYLLPAVACEDLEMVLAFLQKFRSVFLKPTSSSLSQGVYKVSIKGITGYTVECHKPDGKKLLYEYRNDEELAKVLEKIFKTQPYMAQKAVDLIQLDGKPIVFRVHVLKNIQGIWKVLIVKAKLVPVSGIATGFARNTERLPAMDALKKVFPVTLRKNF